MEIFRYAQVESTMEVARQLAEKGLSGAVVAERQTAGRGRRGRRWLSPEGGLYFTVIMRPNIPTERLPLLSLAAGVAVVRVLRRDYGVTVFLKWPNDVLYEGRKLAGILLETTPQGKGLRYVLVGIGMNVESPISRIEPQAVSLVEILKERISREELFTRLLDELEGYAREFDPEEVLSSWRNFSETLGQRVRVISPQGTIEGVALEVDLEGALILETDSGRVKVTVGDCIHLRRA